MTHNRHFTAMRGADMSVNECRDIAASRVASTAAGANETGGAVAATILGEIAAAVRELGGWAPGQPYPPLWLVEDD